MDGQWRRLERSQDTFSSNGIDFSLGGGEGTGLKGSVVQKYEDYGTRLEPGAYRLVLEMTGEDGTPRYLSAEFSIE